jgi:hypothetical protein
MTIWAWVAIGATTLYAIGVLLSLAIGRMLSDIARSASELLDEQHWASAPLTRASPSRADGESPRRGIEKARVPRGSG